MSDKIESTVQFLGLCFFTFTVAACLFIGCIANDPLTPSCGTVCLDDDGCCPSSCDASNDSDCASGCGAETECVDDDGCCPSSWCNASNDSDCASGCGAETECLDDDGCCPSHCGVMSDSDCDDRCGADMVGWQIVPVADQLPSHGLAGISHVLDSHDHSHIVTAQDGNYVIYVRWDGSAWSSEDVPGSPDGLSVGIAVDNADLPHVAWEGYGAPTTVYAHFTGDHWVSETVDATAIHDGVAIALDSADNPHLSYASWWFPSPSSALKYAYWDGSDWQIQWVETGDDIAGYTSLALDSSDHAHISYLGDGVLKYAHWTGSEWLTEIVDTDAMIQAGSSIALDSAGHPHISYYAHYNLNYAYWDGTSWQMHTVESAGSNFMTTSLALDSAGRPHISYRTLDKLKYATWDGTSWQTQELASGGSQSALVLDSAERPRIAFGNRTTGLVNYAYYCP